MNSGSTRNQMSTLPQHLCKRGISITKDRNDTISNLNKQRICKYVLLMMNFIKTMHLTASLFVIDPFRVINE